MDEDLLKKNAKSKEQVCQNTATAIANADAANAGTAGRKE